MDSGPETSAQPAVPPGGKSRKGSRPAIRRTVRGRNGTGSTSHGTHHSAPGRCVLPPQSNTPGEQVLGIITLLAPLRQSPPDRGRSTLAGGRSTVACLSFKPVAGTTHRSSGVFQTLTGCTHCSTQSWGSAAAATMPVWLPVASVLPLEPVSCGVSHFALVWRSPWRMKKRQQRR